MPKFMELVPEFQYSSRVVQLLTFNKDCFISGWEEGGELNAVLSIKVHNKAKVFEVKAGLVGFLVRHS